MAIPPVTPAQGSTVWNWYVEALTAPNVVVQMLSVILGRPVIPLGDADPDELPAFAVLCDVWHGPGEFPVTVDCYAPPAGVVEATVAAELATRLGRGVLFADDSLDPTRHVLAAPDGTLRPVHVDVRETDDGEARTNPRTCRSGDACCRGRGREAAVAA